MMTQKNTFCAIKSVIFLCLLLFYMLSLTLIHTHMHTQDGYDDDDWKSNEKLFLGISPLNWIDISAEDCCDHDSTIICH